MTVQATERRAGRDGWALRLESDRMIYLDVLRVASCFFIIFYHFQAQMSLGVYAPAVRRVTEGLTLMVDLFFFVSGFVISSIYSGRITTWPAFGDFMVKRVARVVPLHWLLFAVFAGFGALAAAGKLPTNHPELYDPRCAAPNLLLLHAFGLCRSLSYNFVSWSISAEMAMSVLFPLMALVAPRRAGLMLAGGIVAALFLVGGPHWLEWSYEAGVLRALPAFLLGSIAFEHRRWLGRLPRAAWWLLAAWVVFLAGCFVGAPKPLMLPLIYGIGALGVAASEQPSSLLARRVALIGQLTYSLYMLHPLVEAVVLTGIGATLLHLKGPAMTAWALGGIALMLPVSYVSLVFFERPARRWVTKLLKARPKRINRPLFTPDSRW